MAGYLMLTMHRTATRTPPTSSGIASLTDEDVAWIDQQLLSHCDGQFRKVAYVVGMAMSLDAERQPGIPDVFYAGRVRRLVERGVLEAAGDLSRMRYSEVRRAR